MALCYSLIRLIIVNIVIAFIIVSPTDGSWECIKGKCYCENLSYIPKPPANTTNVEIRNPKFFILCYKTLWNLTTIHLTELTFTGCAFSNASEGAFSGLNTLKGLNFKTCQLLDHVLQRIVQSISFINVTSLGFEGFHKRAWTFKFLNGITNNNITQLSLRWSEIKTFNGSELLPLKNLRILDLRFNKISKIISWGKHSYLTHLYLNGNKISHMPHFIDNNNNILFPKLMTLELSLNKLDNLDSGTFKGLNQVKTLHISAAGLYQIRPRTLAPLKRLKLFSLTSKTSQYLRLGDNAFSSTTLRSLRLKNIIFRKSKSNLSGMFNACRHINFLKFEAVSIEGNTSMNDILKVLTNLEYLELTRNKMRIIPDCVCNMKKLHTLILSHTWIIKWQKTNCTVMSTLRKVSLSFNNIFRVNKNSFAIALLSNVNLKWDLSNNDYVCTCDILWFRDWMKRFPTRFLYYPKSYLCSGPLQLKHLQVAKYYGSWHYCNIKTKSSSIAVSGFVLGTLSIIFIISGIVSYTKRWSIRYWIYLCFARRRKYQFLENTSEHIYDAFVCYCRSDVEWVINNLLPVLEEENHLHLCLHDRDFVVGNDIIDNITDSIQQSRKVVLVLSSDFAQSQWCQFETSLAQQRFFEEKKDIVVPILLEEIPADLQTKRLALLLKRKTYLEWSKEKQGQRLFWERLIEILLEISTYDEY